MFTSAREDLSNALVDFKNALIGGRAANAALDGVRAVVHRTAIGDCFSAGVMSDGNPYGVPGGLNYSFPLQTEDGKTWSFVDDFPIDDEARQRIDASAKELAEERDAVKDLLGPAL